MAVGVAVLGENFTATGPALAGELAELRTPRDLQVLKRR
jgi:hypothetical protein